MSGAGQSGHPDADPVESEFDPGCVETFVHLSPEIFVTEPAGKFGIRRFGAQNRFHGRERAL